MRPHEEVWHQSGEEPLVRTNENYIRAAVYGAGHKASPDHETARLISAAPSMARALMEIRDALAAGNLDPEGAREVAERALQKAGMLP